MLRAAAHLRIAARGALQCAVVCHCHHHAAFEWQPGTPYATGAVESTVAHAGVFQLEDSEAHRQGLQVVHSDTAAAFPAATARGYAIGVDTTAASALEPVDFATVAISGASASPSSCATSSSAPCTGDDLRIPLRYDGMVWMSPQVRVARCVYEELEGDTVTVDDSGVSPPRNPATRRAAVLLTENILLRLLVLNISWTRSLLVAVLAAAVCVLPLLPLTMRMYMLRKGLLTDEYQLWLTVLTRVAVVLTPFAFVGFCAAAGLTQSNLRQLNKVVQRHLEAHSSKYADLGFSLSVQHRVASVWDFMVASVRGPLLVLSSSPGRAEPTDAIIKPLAVGRERPESKHVDWPSLQFGSPDLDADFNIAITVAVSDA